MQASPPIRILSDRADLVRLERELLTRVRDKSSAVSVQISGVDPNVALAAQKAINGACGTTGLCEAMAAAVVFGGVSAGVGIALGVPLDGALALASFMAAATGAALGRLIGRAHARRRALRAVKRLRCHVLSNAAHTPHRAFRRAPKFACLL